MLAAGDGVRAAIAHAAPALADAIDRGWTPKVEAAVARYALRMAGRPAPFGLLAGVSVGEIGDATRLDLERGLIPTTVTRCLGVPAGAANPTVRRSGEWRHAVDPVTHAWTRTRAADGEQDASGEKQVTVIDAWRPAPGLTLSTGLVADLAGAAELLCALTPDRPPALVGRFARRLIHRYGDAEVALLEALDPEDGIGLEPAAHELEWGARERRLLDAVASGAGEWELTDGDLAALAPRRPRPAPAAFAVQATLLADGGLRVHGVSGPSGARFLGRHAHADLAARLQAHLRAEEALAPEYIHAEVRLAPNDAGEAVVMAPPGLRSHVLDLSGGAEGATVISPAELVVRIEDGRPALRAPALGRDVVPRITSAHAYHEHPSGPYRFLGHLQDPHGSGWIGWDWGPLRSAARLPRVRRGRTVLAPATWRRAPGDLDGLPRFVLLRQGDHELPLDLASPLARAVLAKTAGTLTFAEDLATAPVRSAAGHHRHDVIVPFTHPPPKGVGSRHRTSPGAAARPARAVFKPGSEWTTVKLYCGPAAADDILRDLVAPAVAGARWFFLRYADPEWHLRVRVRAPDAAARLLELVADGRVWRAELDTYVRESARYGDIEGAEHAFRADSDAVLALLQPQPTAVERRRLAATGVALLLADAGAGRTARAQLRASFAPLRGRAGRGERAAVRALVADPPAALADRSVAWLPYVAAADAEAVTSLAHMHVNRLLREATRIEEGIVYDLLPRPASERVAR